MTAQTTAPQAPDAIGAEIGSAGEVDPTRATAGGPVAARPHSHGDGPSGTPAERFTSRDPEDFAVPTGREEEWKFTPLRKLRPFFNLFTPSGELAGSTDAPDTVVAERIPVSDLRVGRSVAPQDRVSALAWAGVENAFYVGIPKDIQVEEPIRVSGVGSGGQAYAHLVIEAEAFAEAVVVVDYTGLLQVAENVEIIVGDGAKLTVISVQEWDAGALHLSAHHAKLGRDASLKHISITTGGSIVRIVPTVHFTAPGASAELFGLAFAESGQHFESRLFVDHSVPRCASNVLYKSAISGDTARTVWIGDVRIRPAATETETYELNRNLLLSDGARADSVPNLEIETGEIISAGHASATGRFDDLQLFYLQARGIPEAEARRLVVRGFFAEVLDLVTIPDLRDRLMTAVEIRLGVGDGQ